jgi:hypothetical protein
VKTPKNATPEKIAEIRERNRIYKQRSRERLYAAGLTAAKTPRTISDEAHARAREETARRYAEARGELVHPKGCPCYDCLWGGPPSIEATYATIRSGSLGTHAGDPSPGVENLIRAIGG